MLGAPGGPSICWTSLPIQLYKLWNLGWNGAGKPMILWQGGMSYRDAPQLLYQSCACTIHFILNELRASSRFGLGGVLLTKGAYPP